jgi:methionyl-tRNA synthetase
LETGYISFDEFRRLDIRVGTIVNVERVKRTEKLFKITVNLGDLGAKQTIASLVGHYAPEELMGKKIIFLSNLKPAKFAGEVSEGMLLAAEKEGKVALLTVDRDMPNGAGVR